MDEENLCNKDIGWLFLQRDTVHPECFRRIDAGAKYQKQIPVKGIDRLGCFKGPVRLCSEQHLHSELGKIIPVFTKQDTDTRDEWKKENTLMSSCGRWIIKYNPSIIVSIWTNIMASIRLLLLLSTFLEIFHNSLKGQLSKWSQHFWSQPVMFDKSSTSLLVHPGGVR